MKITFKPVMFQNDWVNYDWGQRKNWTADAGTVLAGNAIAVSADQAAAQFTARGEWTGCTDRKCPHAVRIVRVGDGHVVATSETTLSGTDGVVNATAIADIVAGEQYRMEFYGWSAQPGTIEPPRTGLFGSDLGTYLEIV